MKNTCLLTPILSLLIFSSCNKETKSGSEYLFVELDSNITGIDFSNQLTETEEFNIIEYLYFYNGGGVAVGDVNNDGLLDLYFSANQLPNKLFLNKGNLVFEDITAQSGLASPGAWKTGVSMADINGDGLLDIYVCRLGDWKGIKGKNELYINQGDLTFIENAEDFGLDFQGFSTQAAFFDYDRDGDLDMYLLNHAVHTANSYGRASLRYIDSGPSGDRLYRNNANKGEKKFTPVTNEAGIFSSQIGYGLGVGISDVNNDGWPDIYISNDFNENDYLYLNLTNGTFKESASETVTQSSRFSMGNDLADINNDGWIDILSLDMLPEDEITQKRSAGEDSYEIYRLKLNFGYGRQVSRNTLQLNNGNGTFSEIAQLAGISATDWSWAPLFADFDNDGWKDLFVSNGILRRPNDMDYINFITNPELEKGVDKNQKISNLDLAQKMPSGKVSNYIYKNTGNLSFEDMGANWGISKATASNGAVYADLDNDGDLDLVVNNLNAQAGIFENQLNKIPGNDRTTFLKIQFEGARNNKFGIGTRVEAFSENRTLVQENFTARGFQSSVAPEIHLGLGDIQFLDSLKVTWPGGESQTLKKVEVNRSLVFKEIDAQTPPLPIETKRDPLFHKIPSGITGLEFFHMEDEYNDFNHQPLIPFKLSNTGPAMALGDANADGYMDVYLGGAKGQTGALFVQTKDGKFKRSSLFIEGEELDQDEVFAVFLNNEQKEKPDLLVFNGRDIPDTQTEGNNTLYTNLGNNHFSKKKQLPVDADILVSVVLPADIDGDGLLDLVAAGRNVTGKYGLIPRSYILRNKGGNEFEDITARIAPELEFIGMVTDAAWVDLDQNGKLDLVIVGDWMPVTVFMNREGHLVNETEKMGLAKTSGWWNSLAVEDLNGDGFPDLVVGNLGLNSRLKATEEFPLKMYVKDFDGNGSLEQIITYSRQGNYYPVATRDELVRQIPMMKKDLLSHRDFAGKTIRELFNRFKLEEALLYEVHQLQSLVLVNQNGSGFLKKPLPIEADFSSLEAIAIDDLDGDGNFDLILGGNKTQVAPYFGAFLGSQGLILKGDGFGNFLPMTDSGLLISGDIRQIKVMEVGDQKWILFLKNDGELEVYQVR
ncbi:VCBS repeat-containing protein [Algoriphagus sp. D3-2-R+10]|uniref:VCBS repeat-containing protein n=1 Tax=Algoriphagus aurantiacus TaxID=3103948 RepID=UPI002B3C74F4|nr:VCBS repeat-containing protein [Algoriphagus sp. D3-2-R+10]MEB2775666.1 VCBS repeat-containing protein [Algoriphagus sp. D3-2-R+10]